MQQRRECRGRYQYGATRDRRGRFAADDLQRFHSVEEKKKALVASCEEQESRRCRVAVYDDGVRYTLIEAIEYPDVRLVYAPPRAVGEYGGDIDNWMWPRHTGDYSFYRAYVGPDGKPADHAEENVPYRPKHYLKIATDPLDSQRIPETHPVDPATLSPQEMVSLVQNGGLVGLGGAAFPSHVKLKLPEGKRAQFVILNGCECEPYLTSDHRTMLERPEYVHQGIRIVLRALGIRRAVIGIEANKPDAIEVMRDTAPDDLDVTVQPLEVKYPQGAEKMLIKAVTGREVPSGKLPSAVGALVQNVATTASVALVFETGQPLIERIMTISGRGIRRPGNWVIPFGTKLSDVIAASGGFTEDAAEIVFGGPMMGQSQASLDVPVLKATGGILVLSRDECKRQDILPCIRCGKCIDVCPVFLNPQLMGALARVDRYEEMVENNLADCMLCGCCSFVCPSNIPLSQLFAMSKIQLSRLQAA